MQSSGCRETSSWQVTVCNHINVWWRRKFGQQRNVNTPFRGCVLEVNCSLLKQLGAEESIKRVDINTNKHILRMKNKTPILDLCVITEFIYICKAVRKWYSKVLLIKSVQQKNPFLKWWVIEIVWPKTLFLFTGNSVEGSGESGKLTSRLMYFFTKVNILADS